MNRYKSTEILIETMRALLNEQYDKANRLKNELEETKETLGHRDSVLSIMWDLVRTTITADEDIIEMIKAVIDVECGAPISKKEEKLVEKFWNREF